MTIYLPLSGQISRYSGGGIGNDGRGLQTLPTTNDNVAKYVRHGVDSPDDTSYWASPGTASPNQTAWFYITHEQLNISPTGTIEFKFRGRAGTGSLTVNQAILWSKKEINTGITQDVIVASGINDIVITSATLANYTMNMSIVEANRAEFESGIPFFPTVSGLLTFGAPSASGTYTTTEMNLNASGTIPSINDDITLLINGIGNSSGDITLYTLNSVPNSGEITLYIGGDPNSGTFPLYIAGDPNSGSIPLFIYGYTSGTFPLDLYVHGAFYAQSGIDLYIGGVATESGILPLFTKGPIGTPVSGNFPLFMWSSTNSGIYNFTDLVLWNQSQFSPDQVIPFVLVGPTSTSFSGTMNLFLQNTIPIITSGIDLFLGNYWTSSTGNISLYMRGPFGTEGAVPFSGQMSLFMSRNSDSTADSMHLFLKNFDIASGEFPLYVFGANIHNSSIPMYLSGFASVNTNSSPKTIFISGW